MMRYKLSHTIKFVISICHSKLIVVYRLLETIIHIVASNNKETYLPILLGEEFKKYKVQGTKDYTLKP